MELKNLTDEQLDQLRTDVTIEKERRQALATIPGQIRDLTAKYLDGGGNVADLTYLPGTAIGTIPTSNRKAQL